MFSHQYFSPDRSLQRQCLSKPHNILVPQQHGNTHAQYNQRWILLLGCMSLQRWCVNKCRSLHRCWAWRARPHIQWGWRFYHPSLISATHSPLETVSLIAFVIITHAVTSTTPYMVSPAASEFFHFGSTVPISWANIGTPYVSALGRLRNGLTLGRCEFS